MSLAVLGVGVEEAQERSGGICYYACIYVLVFVPCPSIQLAKEFIIPDTLFGHTDLDIGLFARDMGLKLNGFGASSLTLGEDRRFGVTIYIYKT